MNADRYDRQIRLFGTEGQARIDARKVAVVGTGGTGSHVVQQLAYLGVRFYWLIDRDHVESSNLNRLIGATPNDVAPMTRKIDVAARMIASVQPGATVVTVPDSFISAAGYAAIRAADLVIGCVDRDGARLVLNEVCVAYEKPLLDLASDVVPGPVPEFGGRVHFATNADDSPRGCLACADLFDAASVRHDLASDAQREEQRTIYGVDREALDSRGPSVVSVNGVIASLAVTELMAFVTGLRPPNRLVTYHGTRGTVMREVDPPNEDCPTCGPFGIRGLREGADTEHWIRDGFGQRL